MPKNQKPPKPQNQPKPIQQPNQFIPPVQSPPFVPQPIQEFKPKFAQPEVRADGMTFGEFDTEHKYPYPIGWQASVVVTQYNVQRMGSGVQAVDEGTRRTMPYNPGVFTKLVQDKGFEDTQYFILHDPRS